MKHAFWLAAVLGAVGLGGCSALISIPTDVESGGGGHLSAGGATAAGDSNASGGVMSEGGTSNVGDTILTGGTQATGGVSTSEANGGTQATDTKTSTGGTTSTDGTTAIGGITSTGGTGTTGGDAGTGDSGVTTKKMFFGNIDTNDVVREDFATYWDQIMPENVGKWGLVQPVAQDQFDWSALDVMYKYANDHNLVFKQHNFFCGNQQPDWVTEDNVAAAGEAWVKAFCERYPNTKLIDVVNEPTHYIPRYANGMGGLGTTGYDWVITAYKWARQYCPNAVLVVNDYNIIEYEKDFNNFLAVMKVLQAAGAEIDAIGAQGHDAYKTSTKKVKARIDALAETTGLPVYITEYDINLADDAQQLTTMVDQIQMLWDDPNVKGFTYWGYIVGLTWRTNAGLVNPDGTFRPAMTWLQDFMKSHRD